MSTLRRVGAALVAASLCVAQSTPVMYKDEKTGIQLGTWGYTPDATSEDDPGFGAYTFGMALPEDAMTKDANEYIGILRCSITSPTETGWCAVSHGGSGQMTQALLLMAWPYENEVLTSFRYTSGYQLPPVYKGNATLTQISSFVNATTYEVIYRCQNCFEWDNGGASVKVSTTAKSFVLGRAQAIKSVTNPGCPDKISFGFHDDGYGQYGAALDQIVNPSYSAWAALAKTVPKTSCDDAGTPAAGPSTTAASPTATATATATGSASGSASGSATETDAPTASASASATEPASSSEPASASEPAPTTTGEAPSATSAAPSSTQAACASVPTGSAAKTYEYIIVGGGAGGIPMADRLSAAGHSVLLIEKGPPSTGRWGGTMKPDWLIGTNLTRFDVPGLCNQIWHDSTGIACQDTDQMAGCVLGGGTAVNAGLWWKPNPKDWDYNFPWGWRSADLKKATQAAFSRIPGTTTPSMDGKLYRQEGFNVLAQGFNDSGWSYVIPNDAETQKNRTYGHTTYMFSNGERGGPLATYLQTASQRPKLFDLWTDTTVRRVIRTGGHITGVELECNDGGGGKSGIVNVAPQLGRVILSAGTFGTAKLLMRSGFGPADQLSIVKNSAKDGATMIPSSDWVDLPVGYNLVDHVNTDTIITHPDVVFYDFYEAWDAPIPDDKTDYLDNRAGILAQSAPNIGPMFWDEIKGSDGIVRQLQWTARVEGNDAITASKHAMTMSQYLGRGSQSRGRMGITANLDTVVLTPPYLHDEFDTEAVIQGIKNLQQALSGIKDLQWIVPSPNITVEDFVNNMDKSPASRRSNHWMGTSKMGYDDGRLGGSAVVDINAKVYGTDNLFVVDASIFPGQPTGNPSAMVVVAAEQAASRILALRATTAGGLGAQCGGNKWTGSFACAKQYECRVLDPTYSICAKPAGTTRH